jgi:phage tail sheath protein FI
MKTYKTPGVYVEEISTLAPSVAEVATAIPAFMGYTEKNAELGPKKISSLMEYQLLFGSASPEKSLVVSLVGESDFVLNSDKDKRSKCVLFYALQLFYANGGGPCWIVPANNFDKDGKVDAGKSFDEYRAALAKVEKLDEPTLLVFPDAPFLLEPAKYYELANLALAQCEKLGDRFAIIDVLSVEDDLAKSTTGFRGGDGGGGLALKPELSKYGAAYFPNLKTSISYTYNMNDVAVVRDGKPVVAEQAAATAGGGGAPEGAGEQPGGGEGQPPVPGQRPPRARGGAPAAEATAKGRSPMTSEIQNRVKQKLTSLGVELTPCAAIAGVYASVDNERGVWKAPANVSLAAVLSPAIRITDQDQENMNVDPDNGVSINAIRAFTGKGTKVWGARTLSGNDNEWRYISVRRFFNMVEESVKKSTSWAVFEPNDINTWVKVRAMIENYLILKWKDGALAGVKPDEAFFVRVGLGQTMTADDVLNGRMIVEIGMAVVRPAEFIILKFSHKLQVS